MILDFGIDDECRADQLSFPGIEEPSREDDVDAGLLTLSRAVMTTAPPLSRWVRRT